MNMSWVLVANSAVAHLYSSENLRTGNLKLVQTFSHPDSRKKVNDLMSDRPGHFATDGGAHSAFVKNDPKAVEAEHFAIELAQDLTASKNQGKFDQLLIVAPTHFYGLINKHLKVKNCAIKHLSKDYTRYKLPELNKTLVEHLFG